MNNLQTASGKGFDCIYFNYVPHKGRLSVRIRDSTMARIASILSDPAETAVLSCDGQTVNGCTKLTGMILEGDIIRISLETE